MTTFEAMKALKLTAAGYEALEERELARDCLRARRTRLESMVGWAMDESFEAFR